jgi:hypothetical protein
MKQRGAAMSTTLTFPTAYDGERSIPKDNAQPVSAGYVREVNYPDPSIIAIQNDIDLRRERIARKLEI